MSAVPVSETVTSRRPGGPRALTGRRTVVMLGLLGAGLVLLGGSRPWGTVNVTALATFGDIDITGGQAAPAGTAVAVAVAAASLVLTIAGRLARFVIPVGVLVCGVALAVSGVRTMGDPQGAASDALRDTLSLGGDLAESFDLNVSLNGWGWIHVAGAVVIALAGLLGVVGSRSWPVGGRRFERQGARTTTPEAATGSPAAGGWSSSADVWDAQNRGEDLTSDSPSDSSSDSPSHSPSHSRDD